MKKKQLPKPALLLLLALSLGAFLYVNADACRNVRPCATAKPPVASNIQNDDYVEEEDRKVPVPAISVLSRIVEIAQKFTSVAPR